jgi:formate--tetrahydrofolate ligase
MSDTKPILEIANHLGIADEHVISYGHEKAKIRLAALSAAQRPPGRLILVTAITPTRAGEGKTTTSIGLAQGLARLNESVCLALREPSLGPTFGMKGGATGGGRSVLVPTNDINLHFNGDFHAITYAHNLLAALLDNHVHHDLAPRIDPRKVLWRRVIDLNDRALRQMVIGLGGVLQGVPREAGFDITAASEIMAVLCLAESRDDLRKRLSRMVIAQTDDGQVFTAGDLGAVGAMMVLLADALMPNLVQTGEGVPALVHGGPFANIAHGCNSVIATRMAMAYADWTITEAGFGADLGAEKFFDIKCRSAGLDVAAVVLVATVRALKRHGGADPDQLTEPNTEAVTAGLGNLRKHLESLQQLRKTTIVAINRFADDSEAEIAVIKDCCQELGVACAVSDIFEHGGEGGVELARAVMDKAETEPTPFQPLYDLDHSLRDKMHRIATTMYGADGVSYMPKAQQDIARIEQAGYGQLPLCVAKTPMSLSGDPELPGRPENFKISVRRMLLSAGAGFLVPLVGNILRMPGLPRDPQAMHMDVEETGE